MKPHLSKAAIQLREQIDDCFPDRDRRSDGWIADARHLAAGKSDHIPDAKTAVVRAIDVDKDLSQIKGISVYLVEQLRLHAKSDKSKRISYIIFNGKICSAIGKFQMWQQTANTHPMKFRLELWKNKGPSITASTLLAELYNTSTSSGIIDYNSQLDPDYTGTAKRFYMKTYTVNPQFSAEVMIKDFNLPLRLNHHIRFDDNTTTVTDGQIIMILLADSGNNNTTTVSTLANIPILLANSGLIFNYDMKYYYYDN